MQINKSPNIEMKFVKKSQNQNNIDRASVVHNFYKKPEGKNQTKRKSGSFNKLQISINQTNLSSEVCQNQMGTKHYESNPNVITANYIKLDQASLKKYHALVESLGNNNNQVKQKPQKRGQTTSFKLPKNFMSPKNQQNKIGKLAKFSRRKSFDKGNSEFFTFGTNKLQQNNLNPQKQHQSLLQLKRQNLALKFSNQNKENKIKILQKQVLEIKAQKQQILTRNKQLQAQIFQLQTKISIKYPTLSFTEQNLQDNFISQLSINKIISQVEKKIRAEDEDSFFNIDTATSAQIIGNASDLEQQICLKNQQIFKLNKTIEQILTKQHCQQLKHRQQIKKLDKKWLARCKIINDQLKQFRLREQKSKKLLLDTDQDSIFNLSICDSNCDI